jgi:hypothetical protein
MTNNKIKEKKSKIIESKKKAVNERRKRAKAKSIIIQDEKSWRSKEKEQRDREY